MGEKYRSISEMVNSISTDNSYKELFANRVKGRALSKLLFFIRCKHGLSQKELAAKIGCSQSRISKIEHSIDDDLTVKDLTDYAKAVNLQLEVGYRHSSTKIVDLIKYHAFKIKAYFDELTKLAEDDESLAKAIKDFHLEAFLNMGRIVIDSLGKLDSKQKMKKSEAGTIHISTPLEKKMLEQIIESNKNKDLQLK